MSAENNDNNLFGKIYLIANDFNNKVYIGQTINTLQYRFNQHNRVPLDKCHKDSIDYAIRYYGKEHFTIRLLEFCPVELLDEREKYWIDVYNSFNNGYNLTPGGQFSKTKKLTDIEEIKEAYQKYLIGEKRVEEIAKDYGVSLGVLYKRFSELGLEKRGKNSKVCKQASINNFKKATEKRQVKIKNITTGVIYPSKKEALIDMIKIGKSKAKDWHNIRAPLDKCLKGEQSTFLGFEWEIYEDLEKR